MLPTSRMTAVLLLPALSARQLLSARAVLASCSLLLLCSCASVLEAPQRRAPVEEIGLPVSTGSRPEAPPEEPVAEPLQREALVPAGPPVLGPPAPLAPPVPATPPAPTTATGSLLEAVDAALAAGELERAAALCERALRLTPRDAALWFKLATIRQRQGLIEEARGHAQRALSLAGNNPQVELQARALLELLDS